MAAKKTNNKTIETLTHDDAKRKNIPTAEFQSVLQKEAQDPLKVTYPRDAAGLEDEKQNRNRDLDPQLVWRGKDEQDWSDLVVHVPPLYIQEKVHPKVLIDDLLRRSATDRQAAEAQTDLFADFNGIPTEAAKTDFYQHDQNWSNRMILGDSLQVMASLAEREGLRGKVQCIYFDPPYGIKFNSNFQWSTTSRDVKDGNADHITREPEQVKAFRDTWRDGIHSYLTYLRDRLTVARDLLTESGSIFVQIGDENVHRIRALLDEIFGDENFFSQITLKKLSPLGTGGMANVTDNVLWYAKSKPHIKFRPIFDLKAKGSESRYDYVELPTGERRKLSNEEEENLETLPKEWKLFCPQGLLSSGYTPTCIFDFELYGYPVQKNKKSWRTNRSGIQTLIKANRLVLHGTLPYFVAFHDDNPLSTMSNIWTDSGSASTSYEKIYVVQTSTRQIQKCILMSTDPGDLVLDPTCGSGTTVYVSEQWGRRWITIDTSRVALALSRARIMGARYPYYLLADSRDGQIKEAEISRKETSNAPARGDIRQGFVYERVPHVMLSSISNNAEIEVIWEKWQEKLEPVRKQINEALGKKWEEWEIPRDLSAVIPLAKAGIQEKMKEAEKLHSQWWQYRIARQKEIDASIATKAEYEYLYDKPYEDKKKVRVAGPFTVESLLPHRVLGVDENDDLIDDLKDPSSAYGTVRDFTQIILENLKIAGVQQAHKEDKIVFTSLTPWPGHYICAEGKFEVTSDEWIVNSEKTKINTSLPSTNHQPLSTNEKRAAIFIGPEFGTVSRPDLVAAAREAGDADFDVLITCAFNYDAHSSEFSKLGRIPVLKARMNADLHMADDLKSTGKGNLFVIFGEPDIDILEAEGGQVKVKINGVDVFHPNTGEVRSDGAEGIACWFIDTDYNEESFFVRHAYFLGANDPYKALKTTLKAEINQEAWATLNSDISRPFDKPKSGRIAVKVINHLGDEVMKVFKVI
ncbi:MAG TPA: site-specific DNA-methyltransferase [Smithella sp.]|nr:site-specific DNA-methyltransferase [Smithella sp.]